MGSRHITAVPDAGDHLALRDPRARVNPRRERRQMQIRRLVPARVAHPDHPSGLARKTRFDHNAV